MTERFPIEGGEMIEIFFADSHRVKDTFRIQAQFANKSYLFDTNRQLCNQHLILKSVQKHKTHMRLKLEQTKEREQVGVIDRLSHTAERYRQEQAPK